jgi:glycerol uptake facilitator-like aquaporin
VVTLLRNNFSSGPDGTAITTGNSGAGDDDAFSGVFKSGANTILAYDLAPDRATAEYVMEGSVGAASGKLLVYWTGLSLNQIYTRMYVYFSVLPNNFLSPSILTLETLTTTVLFIGVNSAGSNEIFATVPGDTPKVMTTGGITAGQWFRLEARVQFSATTGNGEIRWYDEADSDTPTETLTFSGWNLNANTMVTVYYGYLYADTNLETLRISNIEFNDYDWPGPAPFRPGKSVPGILTNPIAIHTDTR